MELLYDVLLVGSVLALIAIGSSLLAFRYGAPLLLLFLLVGLLASLSGMGPHFDNPQLALIIGSLALAAILYESGFTTPLASYRLAAAPALAMAIAGTLLTAFITAAGAVWLLDLSWMQAALLGAILSSTDAAAVFFLLRTGRITIRERVRATLEIESGTNDPMAVLLVLTLVKIAGLYGVSNGAEVALPWLSISFKLVGEIALGLLVGYGGGKLMVHTINRLNFEPSLYPLISLMLALLVFALAGQIGGSGFLAIYVAGLVAGNSRLRSSQSVKKFHEGISWLAQLSMFLVLGLMADINQFPALILPALGLALILMLVARPVATLLCLLPFRFPREEAVFVGWVGLRGAVSILLALLPILHSITGAEKIFTLTFLVVIYSLLLQGWSIQWLAEKLRLIVPPQSGPVERMEFDISSESNLELVAYDVHPHSPVAGGTSLPYWCPPALVLRSGKPVPLGGELLLEPHDKVYFFLDPSRLPVFDRLFGATLPNQAAEQEFFGDVVIDPQAKLRDLLDGPIDEEIFPADLTIAEHFMREFKHHYEVGDRLKVGRFELVVRQIRDNQISSIGLAIAKTSQLEKLNMRHWWRRWWRISSH